MPLVGIGHLTMLDVAPPDWVSLAHDAGFDSVGIRAAAIGPAPHILAPWLRALEAPAILLRS